MLSNEFPSLFFLMPVKYAYMFYLLIIDIFFIKYQHGVLAYQLDSNFIFGVVRFLYLITCLKI